MKDTYKLTANTGPQSAKLPEKIIRVSCDAEMRTKDKLLKHKVEEDTVTYESDGNSKTADQNKIDTSNTNVIYLKNLSDNAKEYEITENWRIKRYGDLPRSNYNLVS